MTREEAKKRVKSDIYQYADFSENPNEDEFWQALDMLLEQETCEDAISREALLNGLANIAKAKAKSDAQKALMGRVIFFAEHLTSVRPKYNANEWCKDCKEYDHDKHCCPRFNRVIRNAVEEIKQPKTGHCKDCKYFEYDHFENMGGIPLITAHEICTRRGLICKTDEDGYCHLWEPKAESEEL